jgi:hypothetical protein
VNYIADQIRLPPDKKKEEEKLQQTSIVTGRMLYDAVSQANVPWTVALKPIWEALGLKTVRPDAMTYLDVHWKTGGNDEDMNKRSNTIIVWLQFEEFMIERAKRLAGGN